ncbi:hypothetical protein QN277_000744 [Acacia crassicarpa]|uniref:Elongation factor Ts, mitochondrial n=1 Tax=Acacia crassicarpa TaxID=499986 RepID=A0AAE1TGB5_9FABA|nr:hypothetical protein QN277_000744 [Acacia crassicarpa]
MNSVIPYSTGIVSFIPGSAFSARKSDSLTKLNLSRKSLKHGLSTPRFLLHPFVSVGLISKNQRILSFNRKSRTSISATETDIAVEESDSPAANDDSTETSETPLDEVGTSKDLSPKSSASTASAKARQSRPARKSEMPPVKNEDLIPGKTFTGKVRSIQPFGAFVDFGAFTDGLVHVSRLSDNYVKDVASVVSVGQEVKVKLIEVNTESQRISLSMRESDDIGKLKQQKDGPVSSEKDGPGRRNTSKPSSKKFDVKKSTKFVNGQDLEGTVKNMNRKGSFISLPDGEEGFLPISEESDDGFESAMGKSSLQVGQEVSVRVLRISRGQVTLTMKKEDDTAKLDSQLNLGAVHVATNPFVLAFRKNQEIAAFLDVRENVEKTVEDASTREIKETSLQQETVVDVPDTLEEPVKDNLKDENYESKADAEGSLLDSASTATVGIDDATEKETAVTSGGSDPKGDPLTSNQIVEIKETSLQQETVVDVPDTLEEPVKDNLKDENYESKADAEGSLLDSASTDTVGVDDATEKETAVTSGGSDPKGDPLTSNQIVEEAAQTDVGASNADSPLEIASENVNDSSEGQLEAGASSSGGEPIADIDNEREAISNISSSISSTVGASENKENVTSGSLVREGDDASTATQIIEEATQAEAAVSHSITDSSPETDNENVVASGVDESPANQIIGEASQADAAASHSVTVSPSETDNENVVESGVDASPANQIIEEATQIDAAASQSITDSPPETDSENVVESVVDLTVVKDEKQSQASDAEEQSATAATTDNNGSIKGLESDIPASDVPAPLESADGTDDNDQVLSPDPAEVVENSINEPKQVREEAPATENENTFASQVESNEVGTASKRSNSLPIANGQTGVTASSSTKATISPALVKQLREETGAGMMDCKKALSETGGDIIKAQEYLRKKGLASAEKKASRVTAEGRIGSYIHDSRIGVLVEVNCETDFVSRGEIFKELVDDIAMQVAACPQVHYLDVEEVPESIVNKEKEIEMQKEDLLSKPEQIRSKIVEGRIRKRLEELALLEQPYIKNDKVVVKDLVKQTIATIGENIKVKRFVRFNLGEGLEKKSQDFAAEVAAQTAAKPVPAPEKTQPDTAEAKETEQKPPSVAVSAALVKKLREETGAGMMDCKKALAETGGDLEKAQEYLRKKGLSSAEKKSSRLAAEGRIGSYIHDSRIGVLIEVNCETDFVGRSEKFRELVDDLAMQVVACPQVQFVSIEEIPESIVNKEKEIEMQREDILSKPENIRERIVEGRVSKRLGEVALLEQPFIKDDNILVKDFVKQTVAAIGENIKVRRFVRFTLGEAAQSETTAPAEGED